MSNKPPVTRDLNLHPGQFYWCEALGDYVAVLCYHNGDPQWATREQSELVLDVKAAPIPQRMVYNVHASP